ncbi:ASCH domain-containing protein [Marinifilum flexuosum]|uniref:ASCH domain-containing protein n=1 Tax=Marinifilum flexuosum TaxID=1117708 RepID=UPI00249089CA|nr:ASCH domain-containing protein [Marinifilum flexuosum]
MSQIHFHSDFYEAIKNGNKTQTARVDEPIPQLGKGEAIFDAKPSIDIQITKVTHKNFEELTLEEIKKDGFDSKEELWSVLLGFYPDLKQTDHLMLIEFSTIETN